MAGEEERTGLLGPLEHVEIPAAGRNCCGVSHRYSTEYPDELEGVIGEDDFRKAMAQINHTLDDYTATETAYSMAWLCSPCTLGVSLFCLCSRSSQAGEFVRDTLHILNKRSAFANAGVSFDLVSESWNSHILISFPIQEPTRRT